MNVSRSFVETSGTSVARQKHTSPTIRSSALLGLPTVYDASDWRVSTSAPRWRGVAAPRAQLTMHSATRHFHLHLPLRSLDVWREFRIYLSACVRYTVICGIPQSKLRKSTALKWKDTLMESCSTDLGYLRVLLVARLVLFVCLFVCFWTRS